MWKIVFLSFFTILLTNCNKNRINYCDPFIINQDIDVRQSFIIDNIEGYLELLLYKGIYTDRELINPLIVVDDKKRLLVFESLNDSKYIRTIFSADIKARFIVNDTKKICEMHIKEIDNIYINYDQETINKSIKRRYGINNYILE